MEMQIIAWVLLSVAAPGVLAMTRNPFLVCTSNVFAVLGLRACFFAAAGAFARFRHLHSGLAVILTFIGVKLLIADFCKIPIDAALGVVAGVLLISIIASVIDRPTKEFS
jgi:tellurite resistance protein TerC